MLDTINGALSGCDSEMDTGTEYTRQRSDDTDASRAIWYDDAGKESTRDATTGDWDVLDAIDDLMAVQADRTKRNCGQTIEITLGSGAADCCSAYVFGRLRHQAVRRVHGRSEVQDCQRKHRRKPWGRSVTMRIEDGETRVMTLQVADVTKPPASAGRIRSRGHRIVLDDEEAYTQHKESKRKVKWHKKGDVFTMRTEIMPLR